VLTNAAGVEYSILRIDSGTNLSAGLIPFSGQITTTWTGGNSASVSFPVTGTYSMLAGLSFQATAHLTQHLSGVFYEHDDLTVSYQGGLRYSGGLQHQRHRLHNGAVLPVGRYHQ
jgi:hypothetical protein